MFAHTPDIFLLSIISLIPHIKHLDDSNVKAPTLLRINYAKEKWIIGTEGYKIS